MIGTTRWLIASLGLLLFSTSQAETTLDAEQLFVTDQIMVALRPQPDITLEPVAILHSGEPLQQFDQQPGWIKVRTLSGTEGWLQRDYVNAGQPLASELQRVSGQLLELRQRTDELEASLGSTLIENDQSNWPKQLIYLLLPLTLGVGVITGKRQESNKLRRRLGGMRL